jgi:hypothetical protein
MTIFLSCISVLLVFLSIRASAFKIDCYRVVENSFMRNDGTISTRYTVEQCHQIRNFQWWVIAESEKRHFRGSVFFSMEEALRYIDAREYNRKTHVKIHSPICKE